MKRVDLVYVGWFDDDLGTTRSDLFNPTGPRDFEGDFYDHWEESPFNMDDEDSGTIEIGYQSEDCE